MTPGAAYIDGIALWTPALPGWNHAARVLRGERVTVERVARPNPPLLLANERRRATDAVIVALEVAGAAAAQAGQDVKTLASVFTSAHGDLGIVDTLCSTLAREPMLLSPTRFHHSVHNAASGYWAIATGCHAASTAVSGFEHSFAAGWLEAFSQVAADGVPVLLAGVDTEARGALASVNRSRGLLGVALVLSPRASARSLWRAETALRAAPAPARPLASAAARALADNAMADALPLFEALAAGRPAQVLLSLGPRLHLEMTLTTSLSLDDKNVVA